MSGGSIVFDGVGEELTPEHLKSIYGGETWLT
jgi:ABC-type phosphate/phosphonate transport system ATPase subunit